MVRRRGMHRVQIVSCHENFEWRIQVNALSEFQDRDDPPLGETVFCTQYTLHVFFFDKPLIEN